MDFVKVLAILSKVAKVKKVNNNEYEIITEAKLNEKTPLKMYLYNNKDLVSFIDKKNTLKFMNTLYELKSPDVKNCIASVVRVYGFAIVSGEIVGHVLNENKVLETFYNYIMCLGQLANMYAFFEQP